MVSISAAPQADKQDAVPATTATTETMRRTASRNPGQDDLDGTVVATPKSTEPPGDTTSSANNAVTAYGRQWEWDEAAEDYISTTDDGRRLMYTAYQRSGGKEAESELKLPGSGPSETFPTQKNNAQPPSYPPSEDEQGWVNVPSTEHSRASSQLLRFPPPVLATPGAVARRPLPPPAIKKKAYEGDLPDGFRTVDKPKRFFSIGRIFKTVWYEPHGSNMLVRQTDLEWGESRSPFYGTRPIAKFRWFIVVRKRLNHSLCFSITSYAGPGSAKARRGRAVDFVVLHSSDIEAPSPYDEEGISRKPIGIIIEEEEQYISPLARLDCGRLYTVEDDLEVLKIGRVHTGSLEDLEAYYRECVE